MTAVTMVLPLQTGGPFIYVLVPMGSSAHNTWTCNTTFGYLSPFFLQDNPLWEQ